MTRWTIEHGFYGCETGCCGYRIWREGEQHLCDYKGWTFDHPNSDNPSDDELISFARKRFPQIRPEDTVEIGDWRSCSLY